VRPGRRPTVRVLIGRSMIVYLLASAQREAWGVEGGVGWDGTTAQRVSGGSGQGAGGRRSPAGKRRGRGADWLASAQREARGAGLLTL